MAKLNTFVHVVHGERSAVFGPGDQVPDWAVDAISNPDAWEETPAVQEPAPEVKEPPRGGPGSSADAWRKFAEGKGVDVPDGASARQIQEIWDAR